MSVRVLRPGLFTTVQDLGRWGWQRYGVVVGGAMDRRSLRIANWLVGNSENQAALEMTLVGAKLHFEHEILIAICGGELAAAANGSAIPMSRPVYLPPNTVLEGGAIVNGCRSYLAVAGGFDVPVVLASRSTYVAAAIGGLAGRTLQSGDHLAVDAIDFGSLAASDKLRAASRNGSPAATAWSASLQASDPTNVVRVIPGSELDRLSSESQSLLFASEFEVTAKSDRMGYRLSGPSIACEGAELISEGLTMGTIQLPPDGQLIVLMADCATSGGYPKVAHVAAVDLPKLAQLRPGAKIRLEKITLQTAHDLYRADETELNKLRVGIRLKLALL